MVNHPGTPECSFLEQHHKLENGSHFDWKCQSSHWWVSIFMGQVTKVRLSCYLVLLSNDSKTKQQDSRSFMTWPIYCLLNTLLKSQIAPVPYLTMHRFVTDMCTCAHISVTKWCIVGHLYISVTKWCIVGYLSNTWWDLWDGSKVFE